MNYLLAENSYQISSFVLFLNFCMLSNFHVFFGVCLFFQIKLFRTNYFRNTIWMSDSLDPDQAQLNQQMTKVATSMERVKAGTKIYKWPLSHEVSSGGDITLCNKINKPLVVYRFSGNVITSIITLHRRWQNLDVFTPKMWFLINFNVMWYIESNICATVLLNY